MIFGFKENKCKEKIYTKDEIDGLLNGKINKTIREIADCNDTSLETGTYYCLTTTLNTPVASNFFLQVIKKNDKNITQILYKYKDGEIYERHYNTSGTEGWKPWVKNITSEDYAVFIGKIIMPAANADTLTGSVEFSYPAGFTQNNCIVVGLMSHNTINPGQWATAMPGGDPLASLLGNGDLVAILQTESIKVLSNKIDAALERKDVTFKLVLMKLPYFDISGYEKGDVDMDGKVTAQDGLLVSTFAAGNEVFTDKEFKLADMNNDNKITTDDANAIINKANTTV